MIEIATCRANLNCFAHLCGWEAILSTIAVYHEDSSDSVQLLRRLFGGEASHTVPR